MIIPSSFVLKTKIITTLVAPHAITDIIHSFQKKDHYLLNQK